MGIAQPIPKDTLAFGVFAYLGIEQTENEYRPVVDALNQRLEHFHIRLVVLPQDQLNQGIEHGTLDFATTNPTHFLVIRARYALTGIIATRVQVYGSVDVSHLAGVIVVRSDRNDLRVLEDVRGMRIAAPSLNHMGGYRAQAYELHLAGISLPNDVAGLTLTEIHQDAIRKMLNQEVDVAFVRSGLVEEMIESGEMEWDQIRVLNAKQFVGFPYVASTRLYPEWPVFALPEVSTEAVREFASALYAIETETSGRRRLYTVPADYLVVEELARALRVPPFERREVTKRDLWEGYGVYITIFFTLFLLLIGALVRLARARQLLEERGRQVALEGAYRDAILNGVGEGVFGIGTDEMCTFVNPEALALLGFEAHEMVGKNPHALIHSPKTQFETGTAHEDCPILQTIRDRIPRKGREVFYRKDGTPLQVSYSVNPIVFRGVYSGVVVSFDDLSEELATLDALENAYTRLDRITERVPGVVYQFVLYPDGRMAFPYANSGIYAIYRVWPEEVQHDASKVFEVLHPEDFSMIVESIQASAKSLSLWELDYRVKFDNGEVRWLRGSATPSKEKEGTISWFGYIYDITDRKAIEMELDRERDLFSAGPVMTIQWAPSAHDYVVTFVSRNVFEVTGYPAAHFLMPDFKYASLIIPEDRERVRTELDSYVRTKQTVFEQSYRIVNARGEVRWLHDFTHVQYGEDGMPLELRGYLFDETREREVVHELELERIRLASIIEGSNLSTWEWNVPTGEARFNEGWANMLGYTLQDLEPVSIATWQRLAHPDDLVAAGERLETHFKGETPMYTLEHRMRHKDGHWVWVLDTGRVLSRDEAGNPVMMFGTHTDISETKEREAMLKLRAEQFRKLIDTVPGYVFVKNFEGQFLMVNGALAELFKLEPEAVVGKTDLDYGASQESFEAYLVADREVISTNTTKLIPFEQVLRKDRSMGWFQTIKVPYTIPGSSEKAVLGISVDITQLVESEAELRLLNDQLERATSEAKEWAERAEKASKAKSEFLASMSHEIRTPMNGVLGMLQLLEDELETPEQKRYAEIAQNSANALLSILNDILDLSKIEAGKFTLETIPFRLEDVLSELVTLQYPRAQQKGLAMFVDLDPATPTHLVGDPTRIKQILNNLVGNAIKFTSAGHVAIRLEVERRIDDLLVLKGWVEDTGIGIPADKVVSLFDDFVQVDSSTSRNYGGSGLGLSIVRQLAELMQGEVGVESQMGQGSRFWFTVPLRIDPAAEERFDAATGFVVLIDEHAGRRDAIRRQMEGWGYTVEAMPSIPRVLKPTQPVTAVLVHASLLQTQDALRAFNHLHVQAQTPVIAYAAALGKVLLPAGKQRSLINYPFWREEVKRVISGEVEVRTSSRKTPKRSLAQDDFHVLLVDDNATNQLVAEGILRKLGVKVETVGSGREALELLARTPFNVVLMDIEMPGMNGIEATHAIRSGQAEVLDPMVPIVAMTAHALRGDRERFLDAGMDDHVTKPIDPERLYQVLSRWAPSALDPSAAPIKATATVDSQVFSPALLLVNVMDDEALAVAVIEMFLEDSPKEVDGLASALWRGNVAVAERHAHTLKGNAASLGLIDLQRHAAEVEQLIRANQLDDAKTLFRTLDIVHQTACAALSVFLSRNS